MLRTGAPTFHVLGLHHTITSDQFSACAFTGKVLRLPDALHAAYPDDVTPHGPDPDEALPTTLRGCRVVEYGNEGSESNADEHVHVRTTAEFVDGFASVENAAACYAANCRNATSIAEFEEDLIPQLRRRVAPGDFVLHPFGGTHSGLLKRFPKQIHVESGIGYTGAGFGAYRIFETEAWRNWHAGRMVGSENAGAVGDGGPNDLANQFVAPNYYDPEYWYLGDGQGLGEWTRGDLFKYTIPSGPYVLFAGRPDTTKGIELVAEVARRMPDVHFVIAGTQTPLLTALRRDNVTLAGVVTGRDRVPLFGGALAMIMPTRYFEPFGGSCVEAMLTGTPVLAPPVGCFAERPIIPCASVGDYEGQLRALLTLQQTQDGRLAYNAARQTARSFASDCYSIQAAAVAYRVTFDALRSRP